VTVPNAVSVVIPAFNAERFLSETINSVLSQTLDEVEVIVVDDGSTDGTMSIVEQFHPRVKGVTQPNAGVASARNVGLEMASGDFVCFLDADDWLYPTCLERKAECLRGRPEVGLCFSWVEVTDDARRPIGRIMKGTPEADAVGPLLRLIPPAIPCPSNVLLRKDLVRELGGFDEALGTAADYDLWLRVAQRTECVRIDEVLVQYRRHAAAMFNNVEAYVADMTQILGKHTETLGSRPEWRDLKRAFYRSVAGEYKKRRAYHRMLIPLAKYLVS
jgi:glycosyltransferase involved in cell wall biosynthesis